MKEIIIIDDDIALCNLIKKCLVVAKKEYL